jgi:hypothetical protein
MVKRQKRKIIKKLKQISTRKLTASRRRALNVFSNSREAEEHLRVLIETVISIVATRSKAPVRVKIVEYVDGVEREVEYCELGLIKSEPKLLDYDSEATTCSSYNRNHEPSPEYFLSQNVKREPSEESIDPNLVHM